MTLLLPGRSRWHCLRLALSFLSAPPLGVQPLAGILPVRNEMSLARLDHTLALRRDAFILHRQSFTVRTSLTVRGKEGGEAVNKEVSVCLLIYHPTRPPLCTQLRYDQFCRTYRLRSPLGQWTSSDHHSSYTQGDFSPAARHRCMVFAHAVIASRRRTCKSSKLRGKYWLASSSIHFPSRPNTAVIARSILPLSFVPIPRAVGEVADFVDYNVFCA